MLNVGMKGLLIVMAAFMLAACEKKSDAELSVKEKLYSLAFKNGCNGCHRIEATVIGPSWRAVADRYKDEDRGALRSMLIHSVTNGSKGKFHTFKGGDGMPAMKGRVSDEHIAQLVDYIISIPPSDSPFQ